MQPANPTMVVMKASPSFAAQIHGIIIRQMADELLAKNADLSKTKKVKRQLMAIGFGSVSVHALAKRARRLAQERQAAF